MNMKDNPKNICNTENTDSEKKETDPLGDLIAYILAKSIDLIIFIALIYYFYKRGESTIPGIIVFAICTLLTAFGICTRISELKSKKM